MAGDGYHYQSEAIDFHEHHFPIITRWHQDPVTGMYWQTIVGHEDCECGMTWTRHVTDPGMNLQAAIAYVRRHYRSPWYLHPRPTTVDPPPGIKPLPRPDTSDPE